MLGISRQAVGSRLNRARKSCALLWKEVMFMTLHEEQERVQRAVEHSLAGMKSDPWLTQRVLARAKGEEPVKRYLLH